MLRLTKPSIFTNYDLQEERTQRLWMCQHSLFTNSPDIRWRLLVSRPCGLAANCAAITQRFNRENPGFESFAAGKTNFYSRFKFAQSAAHKAIRFTTKSHCTAKTAQSPTPATAVRCSTRPHYTSKTAQSPTNPAAIITGSCTKCHCIIAKNTLGAKRN